MCIRDRQYIDYMPRKIAKENDAYFEEEDNSLLACMQKGEKLSLIHISPVVSPFPEEKQGWFRGCEVKCGTAR